MWKAKCVHCGEDIEEYIPCYPVYSGVKKEYRHLHCYPPAVEQPLDYVKEQK